MELIQVDPEVPAAGPACLALGFFDGVHLGHQRVISDMKHLARQEGLPAAAFTFRNHPRTVLAPHDKTRLVCTFEERADLLAATGIDRLYWCDFTEELSRLPALDFAGRWLAGRLQARWIVAGPNYRFGYRAQGTPELLQESGPNLGFRAHVVPAVESDGQPVSSTRIRTLVGEGDMSGAYRLLSRHYHVTGMVAPGEKRGTELGAPTANLPWPSDKVIPPQGVYAVWVDRGGHRWEGVANLGVRPTFGDGGPLLLEVHLLDRSESLYGQSLKVYFVQRLREEKKFASVEDLKAQIQADVRQAQAVLRTV